jgi:hypothetical protein
VLGLAAYVRAGGSARARRALERFAEAVAAMGAGSSRTWPFRALLPWGESISDWHAWGAQMPSALAAASSVLRTPRLLEPAIGDTAGFTPLLMTAGGPDNGWLPAPIDRTQIAYGVDARLQGLLSVADAGDRPGLRQVAAFVAAWYFGANRAGEAMYDPSTGRTYDGISGDGTINRNSGAESTIHGLLSMLALDAHPSLARLARTLGSGSRVVSGLQVFEAESATLSGGATVVTPASSWTGESQWSNGSYVSLPSGAVASLSVPASDQPRLVAPIVDVVEDPQAGHTTWTSANRPLGSIDHGTAGPQGVSAAPGALLPVTLTGAVPANSMQLTVIATAADQPLRVDAVLLIPLISRLQLGTAILLTSVDSHPRIYPITQPATISSYDNLGRLQSRTTGATHAPVLPGGFTVIG